MSNIEQHASETVKKILVANKCDVDESKRVISTAKGQALAAEFGIPFFETSAKANINVEPAFFALARDIKTRLQSAAADAKPGDGAAKVNVGAAAKPAVKKSGCC